MKIQLSDNTTLDITWCGDTCTMEQDFGDGLQEVELPIGQLWEIMTVLNQIQIEHAHGEPQPEG